MLGDGWTDLGRPHIGSDDIPCIESLGGGIVLIGTSCPVGNAAHWFRSTDYGLTWVDKGAMPSNTAEESLHVLADCNGGVVVAGLAPGVSQVSRSSNYGDSFAWVKELTFWQTRVLSGAYLGTFGGNNIVVVGTGTKWTRAPQIFRSLDKGLTWDAGQNAGNFPASISAFINLGSGIVLSGDSEGQIARSTDYGASWTLSVHDFGGYTEGVTRLLNISSAVYTLLRNGEVWKSTDQGSNWTKVGETETPQAVDFAYVPELDLMFVSVGGVGYSGRIYRSQNKGQTWTDLGMVSATGGIIRTLKYIHGASEYILLAGDGGTVLADVAHIFRASEAISIMPVADFSAGPRKGKYPFTVHFTDLSTGDPLPISWLWHFGDREISQEQNPTHIYKEAGLYTVSLTATNEAGSDTETKFGYIEAIERSFIEKRGIEERQQMKIRDISLKRGLAMAERIPIRVIDIRRDPAPKRIWR